MESQLQTVFFAELNTEDKIIVKTSSVPSRALSDGYHFGYRYVAPWEIFLNFHDCEKLAQKLATEIGVEYDKH